MKRIVSTLMLGLLCFELAANEIPDFSANYLVQLNGLQAGELVRTLNSAEDGTRRFSSVSQAKGMFSFFKPDVIEETSLWRWVEDDIQPQRYLYERTGGKKEKYLSMDFDWQSQHVDIDDKQHPWRLKIEQNTLDKLVYQIKLMNDLANGKLQFDYRIADGGRLKTYHINVIEEEVITTPMGKINTLKLTRHRDRPKDRETTLWCAPSLNYLPVKLEHVEKGGTIFTALLRRLRGMPTHDAFIDEKSMGGHPNTRNH